MGAASPTTIIPAARNGTGPGPADPTASRPPSGRGSRVDVRPTRAGRTTADRERAGKPVRCAIYTRKSTEEGLAQEFNSLDAQRESGESYIASLKNEGWQCLPDRYDDGGFSGGTIERPALQRLMADIEAGHVDCVVVYKVDRLSRSLLDFARLMELFDRRGVLFVSVTQQFNTAHSMGRLTLNVLLSFAQFEREIISERTRDKIAAARRKGKYALGKPVLGYDFVPAPAPFTGRRLVVNPTEAQQVRGIFEIYLLERSLLRVAEVCNARGWSTKSWTTTSGRVVGKRPFDKSVISRLLRNPLYVGKVPYKHELFDGEHEAIVAPDLFAKVQAQLKVAGAHGGAAVKPTVAALLRGLVRCRACGTSMTPTSATRTRGLGRAKGSGTDEGGGSGDRGGGGESGGGGRVVYQYYVCANAMKHGRDRCPCPTLPRSDLDAFVVERLKARLADERTARAVMDRAIDVLRAGAESRLGHRDALRDAMAKAMSEGLPRGEIDRLGRALAQAQERVERDEKAAVDEDELRGALEAFDGLWAVMTPTERHELVAELVEIVEYDATAQTVTVTFRAEPEESQ